MASTRSELVLFDVGLFIAALTKGDQRHGEARPLVEAARHGTIRACVTASILTEVYAALTWVQAEPPHSPSEAAEAVRLVVEPASAIQVIEENREVAHKALDLAKKHGLTARRVHDARHAAAALCQGVTCVYTYDVQDWEVFRDDGMSIKGPPTALASISGKSRK